MQSPSRTRSNTCGELRRNQARTRGSIIDPRSCVSSERKGAEGKKARVLAEKFGRGNIRAQEGYCAQEASRGNTLRRVCKTQGSRVEQVFEASHSLGDRNLH